MFKRETLAAALLLGLVLGALGTRLWLSHEREQKCIHRDYLSAQIVQEQLRATTGGRGASI